METEPRNFSNSYPLAGEKIGPLWREIWRALSDQEFIPTSSLADLAERRGMARSTAAKLLIKARKCGQLEVTYRTHQSRRMAHYRVIS
jgi:hypothetical protein